MLASDAEGKIILYLVKIYTVDIGKRALVPKIDAEAMAIRNDMVEGSKELKTD